jgi:hypothetical protein
MEIGLTNNCIKKNTMNTKALCRVELSVGRFAGTSCGINVQLSAMGHARYVKFIALAACSVEFGLAVKYHSARISSLFSRTEVLRSVEPVVGITSDP